MVGPQAAELIHPPSQLRTDALRILRAGVDAVDPEPLVRRALAGAARADLPRHVVAAGKAAVAMLRGASAALDVDAGLIAAPDVADPGTDRIRAFAGGHPAPNAASVAAGKDALHLAAHSRDRGGLLVLLSGGASALLAAPVPAVGLPGKTETAGLLMRAGAAIDELNCVRKHLSCIKGGYLAAAAGTTLTLALSDVHRPVEDDPSVIGSGVTVPDDTTYADALSILEKYRVSPPPDVRRHLEAGAAGRVEETVKPGDRRIRSSVYTVVGNRRTAIAGAGREAEARGYMVAILPEVIAGEAREAGAAFLAASLRIAAGSSRPLCVIGAGETTVTVVGDGCGGRNQEFVLGALPAVDIHASMVIASVGTDGVDGPTDAAGALVDTTTAARAAAAGVSGILALARNDAYRFFDTLHDLIRWGPTGTNVGDLHVTLIA